MSQQIQISGGAKVRDLQDVIIGTSGVLSSLAFDVANGVPKLDSNGKILVSQLPNSVMEYKGTWSAATNTPTLANGTGNQGDVYLCNVAGTVDFGAGPIAFVVGDQVIYSGSIWQRASGATGTVTSVAVTESGDSLNITGSPITTSGTINIGFNGTNLQYVNGAGNLTTFPILTGYVPYTGATQAVNLGAYDLTVNNLTIGKGTSALSNNSALGYRALFHITTGNYNTAVGYESAHNTTTGQYNTALGQSALFTNTTGSQNTALGLNALLNNTTGGSNVVVGLDALQHNTTGSSNTALGYNAGSHITGGATPNTTASNSVYIGRDSKAKVDGGANEIVIGYNAIGNGSNTATFGNSSITANYFTGSINGDSFVKSGGTSAQYLMADGSTSTLTNPVTGTGTSGQVAYFNGTNSITSGSSFAFDSVNNRLSIGGANTAGVALRVLGSEYSYFNGGLQTGSGLTQTSSGLMILGGNNSTLRMNGSLNASSYARTELQNQGVTKFYYGLSSSNYDFSITTDGGQQNGITIWQSTKNVGLNVTSDAGFRLDVNGTARVQGVITAISSINWGNAGQGRLTFSGTDAYVDAALAGGSLIFRTNGSTTAMTIGSNQTITTAASVTAASAIARGVFMNNTLVAAANSDVLVGLDINPTFTNGAFTGVENWASRIQRNKLLINATTDNNIFPLVIRQQNYSGLLVQNSFTGTNHNSSYNGFAFWLNNDSATFKALINNWNSTGISIFNGSSTGSGVNIFGSTNNVGINQTTDAGYKLDVNGTARVQGATTITGAITATATGHRLGNLEILTSGSASTTGQGIVVTGADQTFQLQGSVAGGPTESFRFMYYTGITTTQQIQSNDKAFVRIYGGFTESNVNNLSGNTLWISPTYNFTGTRTGMIARGIYYNPTLTSLINTTHIAFQNTTGDVLLGTTSGSVGIGANTSINASAILDITSTTKGFLPPRMTTAQRIAITTPAEGLIVVQTDGTQGLYLYIGAAWHGITML